jgi:hypothetical protein
LRIRASAKPLCRRALFKRKYRTRISFDRNDDYQSENGQRNAFQYEIERREQTGDNSIPTINVPAAFTGGGSQIGLSFNRSNSWELQNYTTTALGASSQHALKFGVRLRGITLKDRSENNFGGTFTFINIENYRNTLLNQGTPTQFTVFRPVTPSKVFRKPISVYSLQTTGASVPL